jgi:ubiquinone/menaquinone biosynthesis C-methylase UbiE
VTDVSRSIIAYSTGASAYDRMMRSWSELYTPRLLDAVEMGPGQRILDVATGTGATVLMAADRVGPRGLVVGVDISLPMLRIAQPKVASNTISWMAMDGQALALRDGSFDVVTCQLGLMFFPDPWRGLAEFRRVLRPSGRVGLAVLSRPAGFPYGVVFEALAERVASERNALLLGFSLGDGNALRDLLKSAGFRDVQVSYERAPVLFDSFEDYWAPLESGGGRAGQVYVSLAADVRETLLEEVRGQMARFERGGRLVLETETLFAVAVA